MGGSSSSEVTVPPWLEPEGNHSPETVQAIKDLSKTSRTFLNPHPSFKKFTLGLDDDQATALATACMEHDPRLAGWFPKLVPKRIQEDAFWSNYFSHVEYLIGVEMGEIKPIDDAVGPVPTRDPPNPNPSASPAPAPSRGTPPLHPGMGRRPSNGSVGRGVSGSEQKLNQKPMLELTFHARPFGIELVRQEGASVYPVVHSVERKTRERGLTPGHLLVRVNQEPVVSRPISDLLRHLKSAPLPMTLTFHLPTPDSPGPRTLPNSTAAPFANRQPAAVPVRRPTPPAGSSSSRYPNDKDSHAKGYDMKAPRPGDVVGLNGGASNAYAEPSGAFGGAGAMRPGGVVPYHQAGKWFEVHLPKQPTLSQSHIRSPVRWGIIGCGSVARTSAAPAMATARGSEVENVMRRDRTLARAFGNQFQCKVATSALDLIHDPHVSAVYIATPAGPRPHLAMLACKAGKPCLLESPIARSYHEARALKDAFAAAKVPLIASQPRRSHPRILAARQVLANPQLIGTITSANYTLARSDCLPNKVGSGLKGWRQDVAMSGGGLFMEYGWRALELIEFLLGPLTRANGDAARRAGWPKGSVETSVVMTLRAGGVGGGAANGVVYGEGGIPGVASFNFSASCPEDMLRIEGTMGRLELSLFGDEPPVLITAQGMRVSYPFASPKILHGPMIQRVVDFLHGCPTPDELVNSAERAVRTAGIVDAALRNFYRARDDHFWKRKHTWL